MQKDISNVLKTPIVDNQVLAKKEFEQIEVDRQALETRKAKYAGMGY